MHRWLVTSIINVTSEDTTRSTRQSYVLCYMQEQSCFTAFQVICPAKVTEGCILLNLSSYGTNLILLSVSRFLFSHSAVRKFMTHKKFCYHFRWHFCLILPARENIRTHLRNQRTEVIGCSEWINDAKCWTVCIHLIHRAMYSRHVLSLRGHRLNMIQWQWILLLLLTHR